MIFILLLCIDESGQFFEFFVYSVLIIVIVSFQSVILYFVWICYKWIYGILVFKFFNMWVQIFGLWRIELGNQVLV